MVFTLWIPKTLLLLLFALDFSGPVGVSAEIRDAQAISSGLWPGLEAIALQRLMKPGP
jgi:hypothetical protein